MRSLRRSVLLAALLAGAAACENGTTAAGPPAQLAVVSGDQQQGTVGEELRQPLVVRVMDGDGRPVRDQRVTFRVTGGGGSVPGAAALTNRDGIAQERWTLGTVAADSQRVEASAVDPATGVEIASAVFHAHGKAGPAAAIAPVQAQAAGQPGAALADSVAAVVHDAHGNPVPGATVTWVVASGGGSAAPATSVSDARGVARARWVLGSDLAATQTLQASAGGSLTTSFHATSALGAGATVTAVSGDGQTGRVMAELPHPLVVEVRQNGVPVQGVRLQWTTSSGTLRELTNGITDAEGRAGMLWTPGRTAAAQTVVAEVQGLGEATFRGTITPGPPAEVFTLGSAFTRIRGPQYVGIRYAGHTYQQRFSVSDGHGNVVPGVGLLFSAGVGTVSPATGTTGADGTVSVSWSIPRDIDGYPLNGRPYLAGGVTVTGSAAPISGFAFGDVVYLATRVIVVPDAQTVAPGAWARYDVVLEDAFGKRFPAQGYLMCTISWSAPAAVETAPASSGVDARSSTPGTHTITAECAGLRLTGTATLTVQ